MSGDFSKEESARYTRHLILPEVGREGQLRLKSARILLVGAGGLGSPAAMYLAASGIGTLGIVDADVVDLTNLQRQILHGTSDVGRTKLESASDTIGDLNPNVTVVQHDAFLTSANALEIISHYDLVVDGTDNFPTRYLVNDACVLLGKPNMYGSIFRFDGQASVFCTDAGPCYRCLYPEPPPPGMVPSCAEGGVLGVLPGIIGVIQATEAIKWILGIGDSLVGRLLLYDALKMSFRELRIKRDPDCPICGTKPTIKELIDYDAFCGIPKAQAQLNEISPAEYRRLQSTESPHVLIDVREPQEFETVRIPGSILIPLGTLPERVSELGKATKTIVHCHSGKRSAAACEILSQAGFTDVWNLTGGIVAWQAEDH